MKITVLGCGAAYPRAGGACSGYLLESETSRIWVDAGNGTFSNLQKHVSHHDIDALVLSHVHGDHTADAIPLMYALAFDEEAAGRDRLPVYAPPDVADNLRAGLGTVSRTFFDDTFEFRPIDAGFSVGDVRFETFRTVHPVETYGMRIRHGDRLFVYTADTAEFPELPDACRAADLLIIEATFVRSSEADPGIHLWAHEAGTVATKAEARHVVLTHVWPTIGLDEAVEEAAETYGGKLEAAVEGMQFTL